MIPKLPSSLCTTAICQIHGATPLFHRRLELCAPRTLQLWLSLDDSPHRHRTANSSKQYYYFLVPSVSGSRVHWHSEIFRNAALRDLPLQSCFPPLRSTRPAPSLAREIAASSISCRGLSRGRRDCRREKKDLKDFRQRRKALAGSHLLQPANVETRGKEKGKRKKYSIVAFLALPGLASAQQPHFATLKPDPSTSEHSASAAQTSPPQHIPSHSLPSWRDRRAGEPSS